jgi:hypothetical protein
MMNNYFASAKINYECAQRTTNALTKRFLRKDTDVLVRYKNRISNRQGLRKIAGLFDSTNQLKVELLENIIETRNQEGTAKKSKSENFNSNIANSVYDSDSFKRNAFAQRPATHHAYNFLSFFYR